MPVVRLKRAYDEPSKGDGYRILVDRLWPRGVRKDELKLDAWAKELAPSAELRVWFGHDPAKWSAFEKRYRAELARADAKHAVEELLNGARPNRTVTLIYGARDREHNEAVVLRDIFERAASARRRVRRTPAAR